MHGHPAGNADAQGGNLAVALRGSRILGLGGGGDPYARAAIDAPCGGHPHLANRLDGGFLQAADIVDDVDRLCQLDNGVDDQLALAVPGDAPAAVHGDNGQAVIGHILWLGALAGGIDIGVLNHEHHVALLALGAGGR